MKTIYFFRTLLLTISVVFFYSCNDNPQIDAAYNLIERITPGYGKQFKLELIPSDNGEDVYEIDSESSKIILRGNNTIALATAYNQYLKYHCNAHVSWFGDQLNLPDVLPLPEKKTRNKINGKYRVYMNYCTLSYSAAWWDWERWEREIDYMAMNSINTPLATVGLDAVWYNSLLKFNFTDEEARSFLTGPGHSAWQWMQNIQSYGGPLPKSWINKHIELGKKIIERQRDLGMTPIQQGFSGYVPREMIDKYPNAKIRLQPSWCGFKGAAQLDPTDSLFMAFGKVFLEEERKLYGTYGLYAADPFHESRPPVDTPEYLHAVGENINNIFKDFDNNYKWMMQAWSLREDIVKAVPKDRLIILDLNGSKYEENGFWGYPFISGNLHNFGGRINLHGDMKLLASNQYAKAKQKFPNICGSGLFMEGIEQNQVYYDLAFEMPLYKDSIDLKYWLHKYAERRYGSKSQNAEKAWEYLLEGPYREGTNGTERSSIIAARPALNAKKSGPNAGLGIPYSPLLLFRAEGLLLKDAGIFKESKPYRFDIIDIQRQLMSNLGQIIHKRAADAFKNKNLESFKLHSNRFIELLNDVDSLLRTRREFNFDRWLTEARSWGDTDEEKNILEKDATSLVTIWGGENDIPLIFDYSWREWSGLIEGYYMQRWKMFYSMLEECLKHNKEYKEEGLRLTHGREAFDANDFYRDLGKWEINYVNTSNKIRTPITCGDEIEIAKYMYKKYSGLAKEYYTDDVKSDIIEDINIFENLGE